MKRLNLEIFDPVGELIRTHHFDYEAGPGNRLVLTMEDAKQLLNFEGRAIEDEFSKEMFFNASKKKNKNNK